LQYTAKLFLTLYSDASSAACRHKDDHEWQTEKAMEEIRPQNLHEESEENNKTALPV
jgi:hypothetical protein